MIIGQATLGIEILEQKIEFDVLILPTTMDGCGITAGIAIAVRESNPNIKIVVSEHTRARVISGNRKLFMLIIRIRNALLVTSLSLPLFFFSNNRYFFFSVTVTSLDFYNNNNEFSRFFYH